jgi:hypothetical protein
MRSRLQKASGSEAYLPKAVDAAFGPKRTKDLIGRGLKCGPPGLSPAQIVAIPIAAAPTGIPKRRTPGLRQPRLAHARQIVLISAKEPKLGTGHGRDDNPLASLRIDHAPCPLDGGERPAG